MKLHYHQQESLTLDGETIMKGSAEYTIEVGGAQSPVVLTPGNPTQATDLGAETAGQAMQPILIKASGGQAPYTFAVSAGALPDGVSAASDGVDTLQLSGTPGTAGNFDFTITATDAAGTQAKTTRFSQSVNK